MDHLILHKQLGDQPVMFYQLRNNITIVGFRETSALQSGGLVVALLEYIYTIFIAGWQTELSSVKLNETLVLLSYYNKLVWLGALIAHLVT